MQANKDMGLQSRPGGRCQYGDSGNQQQYQQHPALLLSQQHNNSPSLNQSLYWAGRCSHPHPNGGLFYVNLNYSQGNKESSAYWLALELWRKTTQQQQCRNTPSDIGQQADRRGRNTGLLYHSIRFQLLKATLYIPMTGH